MTEIDAWFAVGVLASLGIGAIGVRDLLRWHCHRVGGLWFFRFGRLGGSVYIAQPRRPLSFLETISQ